MAARSDTEEASRAPIGVPPSSPNRTMPRSAPRSGWIPCPKAPWGLYILDRHLGEVVASFSRELAQ